MQAIIDLGWVHPDTIEARAEAMLAARLCMRWTIK